MKRLIFLVLLSPVFLSAQWHINVFGGFSNYSGDLQNKFFTINESYAAFGLAAQFDLTNHFSLVSGINIGHVGAADRYNKPALQSRNLSFQTNIDEGTLIGEYNLFDLADKRFTPYVFAGLAVYHFNPYAYDSLNQKTYLKPLSTEGEGLPQYPDRKPYSLTQLAIPFGGGIKLRVSDNVTIAYEISFRKLFTDYLDDVSTSYVSEAVLLSEKGPEAVEMSYRGNEVKNGSQTYPAAGAERGDPKSKDWYYYSGIRVSIGIGNMSGLDKRSKSSISCPPKM
jgi:hypothetical protein